MMLKKKRCQRFLAAALILSFLLSVTGCGKKRTEEAKLTETVIYSVEDAAGTEVMKVGDAIIHLDDILVYVFQEMYQYSVTSDTVGPLEVTIRKETLSNIRTNYIIYDVAMHNSIEVTDEDKALAQQYADNFIGVFQPLMDLYGVQAEAVYDSFYTQMVVTKFENDIKNELGQTIQDSVNEQYKDTRFFDMYQLVFPYVEVGADGQPVQNEAGEYIYYDEAEKKKVMENAEAARAEIASGSDAEEVAEKYGVKAFSTSTVAFDGSYAEPLNTELLSLKEGEPSQVFDNNNCYTIYVITNEDNPEMRDYYAYTIASNYMQSEYENVQNKWLQTIEIDEEGDMIGTAWEDLDIPHMADVMQALDVQAEEDTSHNTSAPATEE